MHKILTTCDILQENKYNEIIEACCQTLKNNKDKIRPLLEDGTNNVVVSFNFHPLEIVNMDIKWNKSVYIEEDNLKIRVNK